MNKQAYFKLMGLDKIAVEDNNESPKKDKNKQQGAQQVGGRKAYLQIDPRDVGRAEYNKHRFASFTNLYLLTVLGAVIGRLRDQEHPVRGAFKGALGGAGVSLGSHILGSIAGKLVGPRKSYNELAYLDENTPSNYIIPGVAAFNKARSKETKRIFEQNAPYAAVSALVNNKV